MQKIFLFLYLTLIGNIAALGQEDYVKNDFRFAAEQLNIAFDAIAQAKAAHPADKLLPRSLHSNGNLMLVSPNDWTSGFFPGCLWYMYEYTQDEHWKTLAEQYTAPIESQKTNGRTHDMGFKVYCSFGNGYRLTGNTHYKEVMLESAYTLITRFKPAAGIIRSWDIFADKWDCPVIIDNMMNLELLFWAFRESKDSTFYKMAYSHALKTIENHFREDFSSYHVVAYDTLTGKINSKNTHQGYADESAWARGQAWGLYGFTMSYRETGETAFLQQAQQIAHFIFNHPNLPKDLIPYWDFNAPGIPDEPRDVSAAAIIASALYELSLYDKNNGVQYRQWADTILKNLSDYYKASPGADYGFLLLHSTGNKPSNSEIDVPLIYADYYFLEALLRKQKLETTGVIF